MSETVHDRAVSAVKQVVKVMGVEKSMAGMMIQPLIQTQLPKAEKAIRSLTEEQLTSKLAELRTFLEWVEHGHPDSN